MVPIIPPQGVSTFAKTLENSIERIKMFDNDGVDLAEFLGQVSPRLPDVYTSSLLTRLRRCRVRPSVEYLRGSA